MSSKPYSRRSIRRPAAGFSLVELLAAIFISGLMMAMVSGFFSTSVDQRQRMGLQTETQAGSRALLRIVSQELRQAGACLPEQGQFIALDGVDNNDQDSLTLRIGLTDPNTLVCILAATTQASADGTKTLTVATGDGAMFAGAPLVYVTPDGASGAFYTVKETTATVITLNEELDGDHPVGSGIYAIDQRVYSIDASTYGRPVLTVAIDGGTPQPLVDGVEAFNVQYLLAPCPPCSPVAVPADDTQWRQVRAVSVAATVRSHKANRKGEFVYEQGQVNVRPRNLL